MLAYALQPGGWKIDRGISIALPVDKEGYSFLRGINLKGTKA